MASFKVPEEQLLDGVEQTNRRLGIGGYGCVFLGKWRGIPVAVKRHHPILLRDENGDLSVPYLRFLEEFPLLRDCPHPAIVQVFGMVPPTCPQDSFGLVMEYLPVTLRERYGQTPLLTDAQEILIALSVINGLDFLHKRGVIHRDITTGNIMLTEAAGTGTVRAKITDVGTARILEGATQAAQSMSLNPGAQVYMAPETQLEVHQSHRARYSSAADIYSFGVTILAMCNRHEPPDLFKLAQQGRTNDVAKLRTDHPLRPAIVICLQEEAGNRPNASSLSADIVAIQNQVSLGAETRRESVSQESRHDTHSGNDAVAMASARTSVDGESGSESGSAGLSELLEPVALVNPEDANNPENPSTSQDHHGSLQSDTLASTGHKDTSLARKQVQTQLTWCQRKRRKEEEDGGVSSSQSSCPDSTTSTAPIFDQRDDSVEQSDNSPDNSPMVDSQETVLLTGAELEELIDGQEASDNASNDDSPSDNPVSYSEESLPSKGAESPMEEKEASSDILEDAGSTGSAHSDHSSDAEEHFEDNNSGVRCLDGSPTDNPVSYSKESLPSKGAESPMEVKEGSSDIPEDAGSLDSADSDRFFDTREYFEDNNSGDKHPDDDFDSDGDENTAAASVTVVSAEEVYADVVAVPTTTGRPSKRKREQLAKQEKKKKGKASIKEKISSTLFPPKLGAASTAHPGKRASSLPANKRTSSVPSLRTRWSSQDTDQYLNGYPGKRDNPNLKDNLRFYRGEIPSVPDGDFIDAIHEDWWYDYERLERHQGYIQWLFPIRERGMNWQAQELQLHESEVICNDPAAHARFVKSYRMMLHFYGMVLEEETGEITRALNWRERFEHLNRHSHNYLRITRILKCLGEMRLGNYQAPFVRFCMIEAFQEETLTGIRRSLADYWVHVILCEDSRQTLIELIESFS